MEAEAETKIDESHWKKLKTEDNAEHEFNVHFSTFWHLTYLVTVNNISIPISENWNMMNNLGREWRYGLSFSSFRTFNSELTKSLEWMDKNCRQA